MGLTEHVRVNLERLLQLGYSAERAAAFAYRGHARSLKDPEEKTHIARIEAEEWEHRDNLLRMLNRLHLRPSRWLEWKYACIGRLISASCHIIGYFAPMYFAGRLESGNVNEYLHMIELARGTAIADEIPCLLEMARVEKQHELYFLARIEAHWLLPWFRPWFRWGPGVSFNPMSAGEAEEPSTV